MKNIWSSRRIVIASIISLPMLVTVLMLLVSTARLHSQMVSVVNSLADDEFANPYDFQVTPDFDESTDGICEDSLRRCTLRAALEEAAILEQKAYVTFESSLSGNLLVDVNQGSFGPPDYSIIQGVRQKVIIYGGSSNSILMGLGEGVTITGLGFANGLIGLVLAGDNNLIGTSQDPVYSNYFHNFSQNGIFIAGNDNKVYGNRIGIAYDNSPIGNGFGIFITGTNNLIGGPVPLDGNIISGNDIGIGVYTIEGTNYIQGNKIGTDSTGTIAVPNRVGIDNIGPNLEIGKDEFTGGNVISGNTESGILMGVDAEGCYIVGNNIGTDPSGKIAVPNRDGITFGPGSTTNTVYRNKISYNTQNGVLISGFPQPELETTYTLLEGNEIFLNGNAGVALVGAAYDNVIGSFINEFAEPNDIRFNGTAAVALIPQFANPERNTIRRNIMQDNTLLGIYIQAGQGGIQPPVLQTYVDPGGGSVTVTGNHSLAGAVIDFYDGDKNQNGSYEGFTWIGETITDASGNFSASFPSCNCDTIVATATDALKNTSEFSDGIGIITSIEDHPNQLQLSIAYPNPFDQAVTIRFILHESDNVQLDIYDVMGKKVKSLVDDHLVAGDYRFHWVPENESDGMYYYKLALESNSETSGKIIFER